MRGRDLGMPDKLMGVKVKAKNERIVPDQAHLAGRVIIEETSLTDKWMLHILLYPRMDLGSNFFGARNTKMLIFRHDEAEYFFQRLRVRTAHFVPSHAALAQIAASLFESCGYDWYQ